MKFRGREFYFTNFDDWYKIVEIGGEFGPIIELSLKYRSNVKRTDLSGCDGVYIVRSVLGRVGLDSIDTITIGKVKGNQVEKVVWSIPDLSERDTSIESIHNCFEKALLRWQK